MLILIQSNLDYGAPKTVDNIDQPKLTAIVRNLRGMKTLIKEIKMITPTYTNFKLVYTGGKKSVILSTLIFLFPCKGYTNTYLQMPALKMRGITI